MCTLRLYIKSWRYHWIFYIHAKLSIPLRPPLALAPLQYLPYARSLSPSPHQHLLVYITSVTSLGYEIVVINYTLEL